MPKQPAVYILASNRNGTIYIGVTSNLEKRAWEHKHDLVDGFTKKYGVHQLVYYELHADMASAPEATFAWSLLPLRRRTAFDDRARVDALVDVERNGRHFERSAFRFTGPD